MKTLCLTLSPSCLTFNIYMCLQVALQPGPKAHHRNHCHVDQDNRFSADSSARVQRCSNGHVSIYTIHTVMATGSSLSPWNVAHVTKELNSELHFILVDFNSRECSHKRPAHHSARWMVSWARPRQGLLLSCPLNHCIEASCLRRCPPGSEGLGPRPCSRQPWGSDLVLSVCLCKMEHHKSLTKG